MPLSLIMTGSYVNDGKRLDEVFSAIMVKHKVLPVRCNKHLCAACLSIMEKHGYILHAVDLREEADLEQCNPKKGLDAAWWRLVMLGSTGSKSRSCTTSSSSAILSSSTILPRPSMPSARFY